MTHVTCRLTARNRNQLRNLRSAIEYGQPLPLFNACSVLFLSRPRSEGWPHHGSTFSIYPCPLSLWLTLPRRVLSTSWYCPSRPSVAFLAFVHLALFLALSLSPGNSLVSSWCDHSMLALTVCNSSLFTPALLRTHSFVFNAYAQQNLRAIVAMAVTASAGVALIICRCLFVVWNV